MDHYATLSLPAESVFAHVANPIRLGDWLPQIVHVDAEPSAIGIGFTFTVTMRTRQGDREMEAEIAAHEPSWLIAYRLMTPGKPVLIRVTCTTNADGTHVRVHQTEGVEPLLIDLVAVEHHREGA